MSCRVASYPRLILPGIRVMVVACNRHDDRLIGGVLRSDLVSDRELDTISWQELNTHITH
jgi:hypothetical protein